MNPRLGIQGLAWVFIKKFWSWKRSPGFKSWLGSLLAACTLIVNLFITLSLTTLLATSACLYHLMWMEFQTEQHHHCHTQWAAVGTAAQDHGYIAGRPSSLLITLRSQSIKSLKVPSFFSSHSSLILHLGRWVHNPNVGTAICLCWISHDNLKFVKISLVPKFMLQRIHHPLALCQGQMPDLGFSILAQIIEEQVKPAWREPWDLPLDFLPWRSSLIHYPWPWDSVL